MVTKKQVESTRQGSIGLKRTEEKQEGERLVVTKKREESMSKS